MVNDKCTKKTTLPWSAINIDTLAIPREISYERGEWPRTRNESQGRFEDPTITGALQY